MNEQEKDLRKEIDIYSKVLRAGRRTYFFDVRETRAGDYYLTITESKRTTEQDGTYSYSKHKIYLYKEDFGRFKELFDEASSFILDEKGEEVISEKHQSDWKEKQERKADDYDQTTEGFTNLEFDDI